MTPTTTRPRPELPAYCDPDKPFVDLLPARSGGTPGVMTWWPVTTDDSSQSGFVRLEVGTDRTVYTVSEVASHLPGREFCVSKFVSKSGTDRKAEWYCVFVSARGAEADGCDCRGHRAHGNCKHADALRGLIANHWL